MEELKPKPSKALETAIDQSEPPKGDWWFSSDYKRGFCWSSVRGWSHKPAGVGALTTVLYLYIESGIYHLSGTEADTVHAELIKRVKP